MQFPTANEELVGAQIKSPKEDSTHTHNIKFSCCEEIVQKYEQLLPVAWTFEGT